MKIGKYVKLIKKKGCATWTNTNDGEVYLGTGASVYKAPGLPNVTETGTVMAVLDIDKKAAEKIFLKIGHTADDRDVQGCDLSDYSGESEATPMKIAAVKDDVIYSALRYGANEVVFYDKELLSPLSDKLNDKDESAYIRYFVNTRKKDGQPYIVIKDGFQTLAAIMPMTILTDDYITELQDFQLMCIDQLSRDKIRELERAKQKEAEDGKQETIDDLQDDESSSE